MCKNNKGMCWAIKCIQLTFLPLTPEGLFITLPCFLALPPSPNWSASPSSPAIINVTGHLPCFAWAEPTSGPPYQNQQPPPPAPPCRSLPPPQTPFFLPLTLNSHHFAPPPRFGPDPITHGPPQYDHQRPPPATCRSCCRQPPPAVTQLSLLSQLIGVFVREGDNLIPITSISNYFELLILFSYMILRVKFAYCIVGGIEFFVMLEVSC